MSKIPFQLVVLLVVFFTFSAVLANINGAIFTTDGNCSGVNVNKFDLKTDVYLDGGAHGNSSTKLPDGNYDVQVTSPSGKDLLGSTFGTALVHVTNGKFDHCYQLWDILTKGSDGTKGYDDTKNNGGVYKVWITSHENYVLFGGFKHNWSKTDNFKVGPGANECPNPSVIRVSKFDDSDANGTKADGENLIGWSFDISDPCGVASRVTTADASLIGEFLTSPAGIWQICEVFPLGSDWLPTALIIDGIPSNPTTCAAVVVNSDCGEVHEVIFGNIELGSITACKFYDRDDSGVNNNEPPVAGIKFILDGNDILGNHVHQDANSGSLGCVSFNKLLPGNYKLCEVLPKGWVATTNICQNVTLTEGDNLSFSFGNFCTGTAVFDSKGYWHNKNGLTETVQADLNYLNNNLAPWQLCTANNKPFGPINGKYCDGTNVPAAKVGSTTIAPAGSAKAEQSIFLVYNNGDVKLQLAQQLDAFIMNVRHRLGSPDTIIQKPDGNWVSASVLINESVAIWQSGSASQKTARSSLLDTLNNSSAVVFIHYDPCPIIY